MELNEIIGKVICGDSLEITKQLPDNSIDCIVTDPPYGLSFMGKKWDYDVPSVEIWKECLRVVKPGGYLLSFAGTRTQHRMACRIEDAGFEIRDMIAWIYGSGFPKSLNIGKAVDKLQCNERHKFLRTDGKGSDSGSGCYNMNNGSDNMKKEFIDSKSTSEWEGWGTALKPALEPITVARKPLSEKTVVENVLKWGTGGINIDGCRVEFGNESDKRVGTDEVRGEKEGLNSNSIFGCTEKGVQMYKNNGRFPANLIHDGSDEVVSLFPNTKSGGKKISDIANSDGLFGYGGQVQNDCLPSEGSASRFFYCAKSSKSERNEGGGELEIKQEIGGGGTNDPNGNDVCGKYGSVKSAGHNHHPTVKPIKLMEYLVKLVSRENAIVLDPFAGSGSTLIACRNLGRQYLGIEREQKYCDIANQRLRQEYLL